MQITVRPVAATALITRITTAAARESNPDVGSSKNRIGALLASSTAIVKRLRSPGANPSMSPTSPTFRS